MQAINRRGAIQLLGASLISGMSAVRSQPAPPIRMLVGFPAGGSVDVTARKIADAWQRRSQQTVVIDNRSGAGGQIAVMALKSAAPDGNTLLLSPASIMTIYPHVYRKIGYDATKDVTPVASVSNFICGFAVGPLVPPEVRTLPQFLVWAAAHPDKANYASPAAGAGPHFVGALLAKASGVPLNHIAYRGAVPGLQDLMGGQVASGMFVLGDLLPQLGTGRLRLLAVSSPERSPFAPSVPSFAELGLKDVTSVESYGIFLPAGAQSAVTARLYESTRLAVQDPSVIESMKSLAFEPALSAAGTYAQQLERERNRWGPVVRETGFSVD